MNQNHDNALSGTSPQGPPGQPVNDQLIELTSLIETAKILNTSLDYRFILNHIMLASMGKLAVSRTAAVVRAEGGAQQGEGSRIRIGKGISLSDDVLDELYQIDLEGSVDASGVHNSLAKKLADSGVNRIFAIRTSHRLFGYFFIGRKLIGTGLAPTEIEFVSTLCNIAAAAIENASVFQQYKDSNSELQRRVQELQTLFELSKEFSLLVDEPRALRTLEFAIMGQTGARKYAVCLSNGKEPRVVVNRIPGIESLDLRPLCSLDQALRLTDSMTEPAVAAELARKGVEIVIPFQLKGRTSGLLLLGERLSKSPYLDSEINFLSSLCNLAAMAIDNAHLFKESLAKQRLEEELNLAHAIQEKLLPREMPSFVGSDVATFHIPTKQVGGDYFDVIKLNENLICVAIADVSGKGFPAALLMANLQSAFRALMAAELDLAGITERLNSIIFGNTDFDKFITFFAAVYSSVSKHLIYVNAGHNYPFLMKSDGRIVRLDKGGLILGIVQRAAYETGDEPVDNGDVLYMFTDGVSEALNLSEEQFTEERLEGILRLNSTLRPAAILEAVRNEIVNFVGDAPQSDDITQVCVKFL